MNALHVCGIGIAAPGLAGWDEARAVLSGERAYTAAELPPYQPLLLPPNERRRAPPSVRLAFRVAEEAVHDSGLQAADLASVFSSSDADTGIVDRICTALALPGRIVTPTDFHNSVHNAAAGYWSIGTGARHASTSLCAYDGSFNAGLLEAATMLHADGGHVLLVCYDTPPPAPLQAKRPIAAACSLALVLSCAASARHRAKVQLSFEPAPATQLEDPQLEALRLANPAARALPLLRLLALGASGEALLGGNGDEVLRVTVTQ